MKIKFNIFTSHIIFIVIIQALLAAINFSNEKFVSGLIDLLVGGIWVWNYFINTKSLEKFGEEKYAETNLWKLMKTVCIFLLFLDASIIYTGPYDSLTPIPFVLAVYLIYELFTLKGESIILNKIKDWMKK